MHYVNYSSYGLEARWERQSRKLRYPVKQSGNDLSR
jgi:hypothetical protein